MWTEDKQGSQCPTEMLVVHNENLEKVTPIFAIDQSSRSGCIKCFRINTIVITGHILMVN